MRRWFVACAAAAVLWPMTAGAQAPAPEEMAQLVAAALRESGELVNYRVGVKYEDGVAWLMGSVSSPEQAAAAVRLAGQVEGIEHVVNKLEIVAPAATAAQAGPAPAEDAALMLATLQETPAAAAPAELPPIPSAAPVSPVPTKRGMPRPMRRVAMAPQAAPAMGPPGRNESIRPAQYGAGGAPTPAGYTTGGAAGVSYDNANMPGYAWPSYAAYPNYAALTYPQQYSPAAWPYIGPFYPYPQVPLGWRKVTLEWDDGWWFLDFSHRKSH